MADHKITDFVDQSAIDGLQRLKNEMVSVKDTYLRVAEELLKGIKTPVGGIDELERLNRTLAEQQKAAAEAAQRHSAALAEERRIVDTTTASISRHLDAVDKANQANREAYNRQQEVKDMLSKTVTSYEAQTKRLAEVTISLDKLAAMKRAEKKAYEDGNKSYDQYQAALQRIIKDEQALRAEKAQLESYTKSEAKENINASTSYNALSQELARLKKAYRELDEESRKGEIGQQMRDEIKTLDAHLKDIDQSLGDFQRNVGNYAVACNGGVVVTEDLNRVLDMESATIAGCIEQNKELEKAKGMLDTRDASYSQTVERINAKLEENRKRIADVDSILQTNARSVAEAEAQNKQLSEALKLVDLTSEGADRRIAALNAKIAQNKELIDRAAPSLNDRSKASQALVDQMGSLVGINTRFGTSLKALGEAAGNGGNMIAGLRTKTAAFGKTLMGILSNPWVLTFLGIGGVVAGIKWWYDYNKGIVEATKLTKDFTGKSGDDLKRFRAEVAGVADTFGKDFKEVLNATDKLASQLGITFEEALQSIKDGFVANADAQGTFLANINKFAPAMRDAGLSAQELVAIIAQTRSGVFSEEGLKAIQVASDRIKRMPKATKEAIESIGLSADKIQKGLNDGTLTMMEAIQQVSGKIKELGPNSQAVGEAVYNVFGRKAAAGGLLLIESLENINTNLDAEKKKMGELGELQAEQMESQIELEKTLAAVFDTTGGWFETLTTKAKVFVNQGIVKIIEGAVNIINYWIDLYNESMAVRGAFNLITAAFKQIWAVGKAVINQLVDGFKSLGTVVEGILQLDVEKIKEGWSAGMKALRGNLETMFKEVSKAYSDGLEETFSPKEKVANVSLSLETKETLAREPDGAAPKGTGTRSSGDKGSDKAEKEARKAAQRINELEEAQLKLMEEGHEKELESIRVAYMKKIRLITGNSEQEKQQRIALMEAMQAELAKCESEYQDKLLSINIANRLEIVKEGSAEELRLKKAQLEQQMAAELKEAEKTGADTSIIREKYEKKKLDLTEEYASKRVEKIQNEYAVESAEADNAYAHQVNKLKLKYAADLKAAGTNAKKREEVERSYEESVARLSETYAQQKAQSSIDMIEQTLNVEDLSAEERAKLELDLAKSKMDLEEAVADKAIAEQKRITDADKKAADKRMENAQQWLSVASEALNAINDLASAVYDAKIQDIESEMEAEDEQAERDQERISELVENKVITEEEGEARKRAAEAKTAKKQEELEKKKQELEYKQAVWDKANNIAQIGISTALAIMQTIAQLGMPAAVPMIAVTSALGAIQLATAIATPIPKYAKGTDYHKGGLAIVGDGGKNEVVSYAGQYFMTPSEPTLVEIPRGAEVYPDADALLRAMTEKGTLDNPNIPERPNVIVNNDYKAIEKKLDGLTYIVKSHAKQQHRDARRAEFEALKRSYGL